MDSARVIRMIRTRAGLSLRALAARAGTSHSTLAAYEAGRKTPSVATLDRIARAAGYELSLGADVSVVGLDRASRGRELVEVLELAAMFPARHARRLAYPKFG